MTLQSTWSGKVPADERERAIADLAPWFHNLHLPDGMQTAPDHPLGDFPSYKWRELAPHLPQDLDGRRVLDIGCNAGFYSIELARRGALVDAIDVDERYLEQARWAAPQFGVEERISFRRMQVYDLARVSQRYDVVLFMGVLYHLRYPLLALDLVARACADTLVLQTLTMPGDEILQPPSDMSLEERDLMLEPGWPAMAFIENSLAGDHTNWWAPNAACVEAMVKSSGFDVVARPGHEIFLCRRRSAVENPDLDAVLPPAARDGDARAAPDERADTR